jgi:hypothetical protein
LTADDGQNAPAHRFNFGKLRHNTRVVAGLGS